MHWTIGKRRLNVFRLERFSQADGVRLDFSNQARERIARGAEVAGRVVESGAPVYGITTGFGPFVDFDADRDPTQHARNLIEHLRAGTGPAAPREYVRGMILLRLQSMSQGYSGVHFAFARRVADLLERSEYPFVPLKGSVGASGDLIPLAHVVGAMEGRGRWQSADGAWAAQPHEAASVPLQPREVLSFVNGTSYCTTVAALSVARAYRLLDVLIKTDAYLYRTLDCSAEALHPALHSARGGRGQVVIARRLRREIERMGGGEGPGRRLQEIYSLRCIPQILGACFAGMRHARELIEEEMNGVSDNPLFVEEDGGRALHGGNFHAQSVAFACDALNNALTQMGLLAERQLAAVLDPVQNEGAPLLLAPRPGRTSGLAGLQITASAIAAELRANAVSHGVQSISTNGGNQDIVPMAPAAALNCMEQTERLSTILGALSMAVLQLNHLRERGIASGRGVSAPDHLPDLAGLDDDRELYSDLERFSRTFLNRNERISQRPGAE